MKHILALIVALAVTPATADVARVVETHILPGYTAFAEATAALRDTAADDCAVPTVRPAWNAAFDAWLGVSHLHFGPVEEAGRSVAIAYWPDERSAGPRALAKLIADQDLIIFTDGGTAQLSVAARGLFGLEYLLYDPQFESSDEYNCALIAALSNDLAQVAADILYDWENGYAETLLTAGDPENRTYLTEREGTQALFTSLMTGLEFTADVRIGRPMGTFDRPRPNRAESWRSERSKRNVLLSLKALSALSTALTDVPSPVTDADFAKAIAMTETLDDPVFATVVDPQGRFRIEVLQQSINDTRAAVLAELGKSLGVSAGFNSADGD